MNPDKATLDGLRIDRTTARRSSLPVLLVVLALVTVAAAVVLILGLNRPRPAAVRTILVQESASGGDKTLLNASGYVTARREATVSSKVTGKVVEILVEEGMKVDEGQVLARIDSSNVESNLRLAEAQLKSARTALDEIRAQLDLAERELRRIAQFTADDAGSNRELDRAETDARVLQARLDRQAADVEVSAREVALWQQQVDDTIIRAPFSGVVTTKNSQPGEMISPLSSGGYTRTGICTIVDMTSLEIEVDVSESYINRVEAGQPVVATLDAYPGWQIPADVIAIVPTADRQKATVKVRVGFAQLDPRILPDMSVKVAFQSTGEATAVQRSVSVPQAAVRQREGRDIVWLVRAGRVEARVVTLGAVRGDEVAVAAGISGGDRIVVEGPDNLTDGAGVTETKR